MVRNGHLVLDEPTTLPEGTVLDLVVDDEGDDLDEAERAALHAHLECSWAESERGQLMKVAQGRVLRGEITTRARFPEGARLTLVQHDERSPVDLDPDEEAGVLAGITEIEAGKGIPASRLRQKLRRR